MHVIKSLGPGKTTHLLERSVLADQGPGASRHVIVSLADSELRGHPLRAAGAELHCLGLVALLRVPGALIRLTILMRRLQPDVVMTWLNHAHLLATFAAMTSGVGTRRMVWNLSGSSPNASGRGAGVMLMLLAGLSRLPSVIAVGSRSGKQAYEALGYRPRHWFPSYNSARESETEKVLNSYRQLWQFASNVSDRRRFGARFRRSWYRRFGPAHRWLEEWRARIHRLRHSNTTFVGVTGSCGKTSTAGLVGAVLETGGECQVCAGPNHHSFVIKNILSVGPSTKFCVQEVSGCYLGRVREDCWALRPQIGIVTTVGSDHYRNFRSLEATAQSKGQLVELLPKTGTAILNADDPHVRAMVARTRARVLLFGLSPDADIRATEVSSAWPSRLAMTVSHGTDTLRIQTRFVGEHWTTSVLAAVACGLACGIDLKNCAKAIENFEPMFGRYSVHVKPIGPTYVFDHKAPYWTIAAGLAFVKSADAPRTTIVLGTISDYSGAAGKRYRSIAREALEIADRVVFVGPQSSLVGKLRQGELRDRLYAFATTYQASEFLAQATVPGELVFIKGSLNTDHLERIILSQFDKVVCWREGCRREVECLWCRDYLRPHPPPFGLAEIDPQAAVSSPQRSPALVGSSEQKTADVPPTLNQRG